jgi:HPt (histidine-containing phosphotransfer) domain-containing protein
MIPASPSAGSPPPALDLAHLDRQTFGEAALKRDVLLMFLARSRALLKAMAEADVDERADLAHALKGSALAIGAFALADAAAAAQAVCGRAEAWPTRALALEAERAHEAIRMLGCIAPDLAA